MIFRQHEHAAMDRNTGKYTKSVVTTSTDTRPQKRAMDAVGENPYYRFFFVALSYFKIRKKTNHLFIRYTTLHEPGHGRFVRKVDKRYLPVCLANTYPVDGDLSTG